MEPIEIGDIGNYYGSLNIATNGKAYFWSIQDYDGHGWEEIPQYLFEALLRYEEERLHAKARDSRDKQGQTGD